MTRLAPVFFSLLLLAGCDLLGSDNPDTQHVVAAVYVANQGNFSEGTGSVSTYDPDARLSAPGALTQLGTVVQSVFVRDTLLYVVGNTSGEVRVFDARGSLRSVATIGGMLAPRYMAATDTLGFVTNLYGDAATFSGGTVSVLDLRRNVKLYDVPVGNNPEGIAVVGERVYVANSGFGEGSTVSVLARGQGGRFEVVETRDAHCEGPRTVLADAQDEVWVFCTGRTLYDPDFNVIGRTAGAAVILDGTTGRLVKKIGLTSNAVGATGLGQDAFYSAAAQEAYAVVDGSAVMRFDTRTNTWAATLSQENLGGDATSIGALAYDAAREQLYLGRVPGFTTSGSVSLHARDGAALGSFSVGIAPSFLAFREEAR